MTARRSVRALLAAWERTAASLATGYEFGLDDWRNDLDGRRLLAAALGDDARRAPTFRARLAAADALVRAATRPFPVSVWGTRNATREGWDRDCHWYYFVVPTRGSAGLEADLRHVR